MSILHKIIDWLERRLNLSEIFSWVTTFGISYVPLNPNQPFRDVFRDAFLKPVPTFQWPHMLGLFTFVTFLMEGVTGLLLAFYYQPIVGGAYESTRTIIRDTSFGWYIHQMHYWGAQLLLLFLLIRIGRFIIHRVYRAPRELFWVFGVVLLALTSLAAFTGRLLPWHQGSYWGTLRGLELFQRIPIAGPLMTYLVGGMSLDGFLLSRFYLLHIIFIPILLLFFFYLHFATLRRVGLSPIESGRVTTDRPIYPRYLMNLLILLLALFGLILTLGVLFPSPFLAQADPYSTPTGMSVPWYALPVYGIMEMAPGALGGWIVFIGFWILFLLPFADYWAERVIKKPWVLNAAGLVILVFLIYATYYGYRERG